MESQHKMSDPHLCLRTFPTPSLSPSRLLRPTRALGSTEACTISSRSRHCPSSPAGLTREKHTLINVSLHISISCRTCDLRACTLAHLAPPAARARTVPFCSSLSKNMSHIPVEDIAVFRLPCETHTLLPPASTFLFHVSVSISVKKNFRQIHRQRQLSPLVPPLRSRIPILILDSGTIRRVLRVGFPCVNHRSLRHLGWEK